ncbi:MAG: 3-methyl-2-oxobutanoate hydroxymethyltransferase [Proteobacteria bacterium]|nr:3-methyl-2-oxobutanoate hydroxymethyltransferase [Pseudomonadota bacterium]
MAQKPEETAAPSEAPITAPSLRQMKRDGRPIVALTAYDATFGRLLDEAGVDVVLVGDSLGMVIKGEDDTLAVTLDEMIYHARAVRRGVRRAHLVVDMPFMTYQVTLADGLRNAGRLVREGGAAAVKLEGGRRHAELVLRLTEIGIPVMGHLGLMPQSVRALGGYRVQARAPAAAQALLDDALALQQAGAYALVLEAVPRELAREVTAALEIPTIGIGAGADCDGQVLVLYDLLGLDPSFAPRFVKRFAPLGEQVVGAVSRYGAEVRARRFPTSKHGWSRAAAPRARRSPRA